MAITVMKKHGAQAREARGLYLVKASGAAVTGAQAFYRIGRGFSDANEQMNPQTKQANYIDGRSNSVTTGFQESWPISGERYVGDYANDLLARMAESRAKGADAGLIMVTVNFFEEAVDDSDPDVGLGIYRAFRQGASYSPESGGGGAATDSVTISGTVNGSGVQVEGWFKPNGAPTADDPELVLRDMGLFSTDITDL